VRKREAQYLSKVADIGCIICYRAGYPGTPAEIHHIRGLGLGMGVRNSHDNVLPLCPSHHRGNSGYHGLGRKAFERAYGVTEQELQLQLGELLNEEDQRPEEGSQGYEGVWQGRAA
jgi:hypothetical protein